MWIMNSHIFSASFILLTVKMKVVISTGEGIVHRLHKHSHSFSSTFCGWYNALNGQEKKCLSKCLSDWSFFWIIIFLTWHYKILTEQFTMLLTYVQTLFYSKTLSFCGHELQVTL